MLATSEGPIKCCGAQLQVSKRDRTKLMPVRLLSNRYKKCTPYKRANVTKEKEEMVAFQSVQISPVSYTSNPSSSKFVGSVSCG